MGVVGDKKKKQRKPTEDYHGWGEGILFILLG